VARVHDDRGNRVHSAFVPDNLKFFILIFNIIFENLNEGFILNRAAKSQHLIAVF